MALPDRKHWSAKSLARRDELKDAVEIAVEWVLTHRAQTAWGLGAVAAAAVALGFVLYARRAREDAAWNKLGLAEGYIMVGRAQDAEPLLTQTLSEAGGAAATGMARLLEGDLRFPRGEYDQALAAYEQAAADAPEPLKPFAQVDKILTLEAAGKPDQCAAAAQAFIDAHAEHLLAPQVHVSLARCQQAEGQTAAAQATLQKISLQYPKTPWSAWADARLSASASK